MKFISHSSLDIRTRTITGELLALLRFLDSPIDDLSFATFLFGEIMRSVPEARAATGELREHLIRSRHADGEAEPLYAHLRSTAPELWEEYFDKLFAMVGYLPLYDLVSQLYGTFSLMDRFAEEHGTPLDVGRLEDQDEAERDERVHAAPRDPVDQLLEELRHALGGGPGLRAPSTRRTSPRRCRS